MLEALLGGITDLRPLYGSIVAVVKVFLGKLLVVFCLLPLFPDELVEPSQEGRPEYFGVVMWVQSLKFGAEAFADIGECPEVMNFAFAFVAAVAF